MKWFAISGAVLVVVGIIGIGSLTAAGNTVNWHRPWTFGLATRGQEAPHAFSIDETKRVSAHGATSLQVTVDTAAVSIKPGPGHDFSAHLYGDVVSSQPKSDVLFTVNESGNQVVIQVRHKTHFTMSFGINRGLQLDVVVPKAVYDSLSVQSDTGKVSVKDLNAKNMTLHLDTGALNINHVIGNLTATTDTGAVDVQSATGRLNLTADTGKISVMEPNITNDITAKTDTGAITITSEAPPTDLSFNLSASVGSVHADVPNAQVTSNTHSSVNGSVGSGGPAVTATSDVGTVSFITH